MPEMIPRSGELLALLSAVLFGLGGVIVRKGQRRQSADTGIFVSVVMNFVVSTIALGYVLATSALPAFDWRGVAIFVIAGFVTSFLGRASYFASVKHIGPSRAIGYRISSPLLTLATAALLLGEFLEPIQFLGFAAVMGGIWVLTREVSAHGRRSQTAPMQSSTVPTFEPRLGILFGLGAALALGVGHALRKFGMVFVPSPIFGSWLGALVALLGILATYISRRSLGEVFRSNFRPLNVPYFISGIFVSLGQLTLFVALYLSPASLAVAIGSTEPLWVLLFSRLLLGVDEHVSGIGLLAILVICIGVAIILAA